MAALLEIYPDGLPPSPSSPSSPSSRNFSRPFLTTLASSSFFVSLMDTSDSEMDGQNKNPQAVVEDPVMAESSRDLGRPREQLDPKSLDELPRSALQNLQDASESSRIALLKDSAIPQTTLHQLTGSNNSSSSSVAVVDTDLDTDTMIPFRRKTKRDGSDDKKSSGSSSPTSRFRRFSKELRSPYKFRQGKGDAGSSKEEESATTSGNGTPTVELGGLEKPLTHFRPHLWRLLDRDREVVNLDLFWPQKNCDESDTDSDDSEANPTIFPLEELKPLIEFRKLKTLHLGGMLQSYQKYIWMTCWLNPQMEDLVLEMALEPEIVKEPYRKAWPKIEGKWKMKSENQGSRKYLGDEGEGILHMDYGYGEYLDIRAIKAGHSKATKMGVNLPHLPIANLTLTGFVVDAGPFARFFDSKKLRSIEFKADCIDAGFALPPRLAISVNVVGGSQARLVTVRHIKPGDIKIVDIKKPKSKTSSQQGTQTGESSKSVQQAGSDVQLLCQCCRGKLLAGPSANPSYQLNQSTKHVHPEGMTAVPSNDSTEQTKLKINTAGQLGQFTQDVGSEAMSVDQSNKFSHQGHPAIGATGQIIEAGLSSKQSRQVKPVVGATGPPHEQTHRVKPAIDISSQITESIDQFKKQSHKIKSAIGAIGAVGQVTESGPSSRQAHQVYAGTGATDQGLLSTGPSKKQTQQVDPANNGPGLVTESIQSVKVEVNETNSPVHTPHRLTKIPPRRMNSDVSETGQPGKTAEKNKTSGTTTLVKPSPQMSTEAGQCSTANPLMDDSKAKVPRKLTKANKGLFNPQGDMPTP